MRSTRIERWRMPSASVRAGVRPGLAEEQGVSPNSLVQSLLASGTAALEPCNHAIGHAVR